MLIESGARKNSATTVIAPPGASPRAENSCGKEESMEAELSLSRAAIDALADDIAETAAHIDAATHRLLVLIRDFDRAGGWHQQGALSCAHWLSWRIGLGLGPAREKVRVAHRLAELPLMDEALRRGELSYSKVRAMTRVATPANEAALLDQARNTTAAQLERICRFARQATSLAGEDPRSVEDRRCVEARATDDGMVSIQIRLLPDEAARLMRALELGADGGCLADGAVALAESALAGTPPSTDRPVRPPVEVILHVEAATLEGRTEAGDGLSAETCRRLLCDAGVVPLVEDAAGRTIDVGRKTRTIPVALRRALHARDRGCRFPGCTNRRVDAHHLVHWIDGGETSLANTALLCRRHHRLLHEHGFAIERRDGELAFFDRHGRAIPPAAARRQLPEGSFDRLRTDIDRSGIEISAETNRPGWDGAPVDYDSCVAALTRTPVAPKGCLPGADRCDPRR
jgi:hypothetical protein